MCVVSEMRGCRMLCSVFSVSNKLFMLLKRHRRRRKKRKIKKTRLSADVKNVRKKKTFFFLVSHLYASHCIYS